MSGQRKSSVGREEYKGRRTNMMLVSKDSPKFFSVITRQIDRKKHSHPHRHK